MIIFLSNTYKIFLNFVIDIGILNTMTDETNFAQDLLAKSGISLIDAVRLILNALDSFPQGSHLSPIQFCSKIIETGKRHMRTKEMSVKDGFYLYLGSKSDLRQESLQNIRYLGNRLLKSNPEFANRNFSDLSVLECQMWLSEGFRTPCQYNKARTMLHGLFEFAMRMEWCEKNMVKLVQRRKVVEKEILPLSISETRRLLKTSQTLKKGICFPGTAILTLAGIRPREVMRLEWKDIDLAEGVITIRSKCSKTGGTRQVEISPALKHILEDRKPKINSHVCPTDWKKYWRKIRDTSGFKGCWVQDVLRHTYASFFAKHYRDLPRLQLNMGHRDLSLLRSRYINMRGISSADAKIFFIRIF